jgi:LuxR family maltose regulon positive regulatory protein
VGELRGTSGPGAELPALAEAKLAAPRDRPGMLARPRIRDTLDPDAALTLVSAPAGYGKTTAVRSWSANRGSPLAWVTLDGSDNDPARLWAYVATAIDRVRDGLPSRALDRLRTSGISITSAVDELMNGVADFTSGLDLVLDDFHTVTDGECVSSIALAVEHLPPTARIIVITRADPALGLARLRARGALTELRAGELAFTAAEARELLVDRGRLQIGDEDVEILLNRTEGWPAALYLATLWLRTVSDPRRAVRRFGGDHRYVAEYLSHEVLGALSPADREFLVQAAVLGRFTADMCDGVLGRSDSAQRLSELEQSNLFVIRLERGGWLRTHALFAQFAAARFASLQPGAVTQIHRRAAEWLRARGLIIDAVEHGAAAGDHELVADILSEHHITLIRSGRSATLLRWVRTLPDEYLVDSPRLTTAAAEATERRRYLGLARRSSEECPDRFGVYEQGVVAMVRAGAMDYGVQAAVADGYGAVELAERGADTQVAALATLAQAEYFAGNLDGAWSAAWSASEHPDAARRAPGYALARSVLALVATDRGWMSSARQHAQAARAVVGQITSSRSWLGAHAAVALGAVLLADGELGAAEREFSYAERFLREDVASVSHADLLVRLADVRCRRGRVDDADAALIQVREAIDDLADCGMIAARAATVERRLLEVRRQARANGVPHPPSEAELAVLRLLGGDLSARQIANELFLSPNTIRSHTRAIYRKLGVSSRPQAVARATAAGLMG